MGSGLEYGTAYYTVFVFESSGSAKYAVVQVPLRFRFDREVLVFSPAAPLPDVGGQKHIRAHMHTQRYRRTHKHAHAFLNPNPFLACVRALRA